MPRYRKMALVIALLCLFPFAAVLVANLIAVAAGCDFDMAMRQACLIGGADIGGLLQALGAFGYATFFTVPLLIVTALTWAVAELIHWLRSRRANKAPLQGPLQGM